MLMLLRLQNFLMMLVFAVINDDQKLAYKRGGGREAEEPFYVIRM